MRLMVAYACFFAMILCTLGGCRSGGSLLAPNISAPQIRAPQLIEPQVSILPISSDSNLASPERVDTNIRRASFQDSEPSASTAERIPSSESEAPVTNNLPFEVSDNLLLISVIKSTVDFYPEIEAVLHEIDIAEGEITSALGSFDTKLKIDSENTPIGFYETYRNRFGLEQPTFNGGSLFGGYRFGRGDMEPWYLERNTNAGGELSLGANWALLRGRDIDARRLTLWKANLKRRAAEPAIRYQLILACRNAEIAYWNWVAAGQIYQLNKRLLDIAKSRVDGIEARIAAEDLAEITRTDNDRTILSREVKVTESLAKLQQAAIEVSLFYRDTNGYPIVPLSEQIPEIETNIQLVDMAVEGLISEALCCRPELQTLGLEMQRIRLEIAKAKNDLLPSLNAQFGVSQDFGRPTSASAAASSSGAVFANFGEKDEFQVDAGLFLGQDLQRRKATGKIRSLCNKLHQLEIKNQFLQQKIETEVRQNYQLTIASNQQIQQAVQSLDLAKQLSVAARERYDEGDVDLFEIILREGQELDAANDVVNALFGFYAHRANLNAAIACDEYQLFDSLIETEAGQ